MKKQTQNKPNLPEGKKMMQSLYIQMIMKKYAAKRYEKTNPIKPNFTYPQGGKTEVRRLSSVFGLLFPNV